MGEYRKEESLKLLEDIYIQSYSINQAFINTIATEAILKIGKVTDGFIEILRNQLLKDKNYYYIRNSIFIINALDNVQDILEIFEKNF